MYHDLQTTILDRMNLFQRLGQASAATAASTTMLVSRALVQQKTVTVPHPVVMCVP
jgi:hypothetical protein